MWREVVLMPRALFTVWYLVSTICTTYCTLSGLIIDNTLLRFLPKSAPPLHFNIPVPLPRNVLLFYTPSLFALFILTILANLCLPVSHIMYLVMYYCSIAVAKSLQLFLYPHQVVFIFFIHIPSLNLLLFLTPACLAIFFYFQPLFFIAEFLPRIHLMVSLSFHIVPSFYSQCIHSTCLVVLVDYIPFQFLLL